MILYSNNCPKCRLLKSELEKQNIEFTVSQDFEKLTSKGIMSVPVLDLEDGRPMMLFQEAMQEVQGGKPCQS